jgi:signal transduction histidine kinase
MTSTGLSAATTREGSARRPAGRPKLFLLAWVNVLLVIPGWVLISVLIASVATAVVWVGLFLWLVTAHLLGHFAGLNRRIAGAVLGERITGAYQPPAGRGLFARLGTLLSDPARWRDIAFLFVALSLGFAISLSAVIAFFIFPIGYWLSPLLLRTYATTTRALIGPTGEAALQERIGQLETSRSESVDHSAAELRRIERDLHDGAQAQLVALGMNLGLAQELVRSDPEAATALIAEARTSSSSALADLRSLVRGIHPPVLADRGLTGGLQALALSSPMDVDIDVELAGRPPAPVESAVYFAVAEAVTNATKYAAAGRIWIWARHADGVLTALVGDDGVGGARFTPEGGLAGIERRMAAFDGGVSLASPYGGPTIVTLRVPCPLELPQALPG